MGRLFNALKIMAQNCIVDAGVTDGWTWKKYADGRYEAEAIINEGNFGATLGLATVEGSVKLYATNRIPATLPTPPHTLTAGRVIAAPVGNATGWGFVLNSTGWSFQLGRFATSDTFVFNNVHVHYKVVGGKWK